MIAVIIIVTVVMMSVMTAVISIIIAAIISTVTVVGPIERIIHWHIASIPIAIHRWIRIIWIVVCPTWSAIACVIPAVVGIVVIVIPVRLIIGMSAPVIVPPSWLIVVANADRDIDTRTIPVIVVPVRIRIPPGIISAKSWRRSIVVVHYHIVLAGGGIGINYCVGKDRLRLMDHTRLADDHRVLGLTNHDLLLHRASITPVIAVIACQLGIATACRE
jgi:hypothetical protein